MARRRSHRRYRRDASPPGKKKKISPLALGLVGAGVAGAVFLLTRESKAAPAPAPGPALPPVVPGPGTVIPPIAPPGIPAGLPVGTRQLVVGKPATVVTVSSLNLREGPSTSANVLDSLQTGTGVVPVEPVLANGWVRVRVAGTGAVGFVCHTCPELPSSGGGVPITVALRQEP